MGGGVDSVPPPTHWQLRTRAGVPWCRYCGTLVAPTWSDSPWGRNTLCRDHSDLFKQSAEVRVPAADGSSTGRLQSTRPQHQPQGQSQQYHLQHMQPLAQRRGANGVACDKETLTDRLRPVTQEYCDLCLSAKGESQQPLVACHGCPRAYHPGCLPSASDGTDGRPWFCSSESCCAMATSGLDVALAVVTPVPSPSPSPSPSPPPSSPSRQRHNKRRSPPPTDSDAEPDMLLLTPAKSIAPAPSSAVTLTPQRGSAKRLRVGENSATPSSTSSSPPPPPPPCKAFGAQAAGSPPVTWCCPPLNTKTPSPQTVLQAAPLLSSSSEQAVAPVPTPPAALPSLTLKLPNPACPIQQQQQQQQQQRKESSADGVGDGVPPHPDIPRELPAGTKTWRCPTTGCSKGFATRLSLIAHVKWHGRRVRLGLQPLVSIKVQKKQQQLQERARAVAVAEPKRKPRRGSGAVAVPSSDRACATVTVLPTKATKHSKPKPHRSSPLLTTSSPAPTQTPLASRSRRRTLTSTSSVSDDFIMEFPMPRHRVAQTPPTAKKIVCPGFRLLEHPVTVPKRKPPKTSKAAGPEEDVSDEAFAQRHLKHEQEERKRHRMMIQNVFTRGRRVSESSANADVFV